MERPPAVVGQGVDEVDTPALLLDLDAFERNCNSLTTRLREYPNVAIRPHAKVRPL
jgi:3-hydroxy-D-aspartate aldolase